ncbi:hypothetical protein RBE51_18600 [Pseudomonas taiwanensis]|uniref:hypothetical protein n=1 Tax=Pseudomonas taiwanensis TaxID=470150 RepID=UPI0028E05197|nr:hypothetical protein [Pseudomonas taiwanensis]MDT8924804.1 hypothetical protein [Pseudomonas taiwanensis]
MTRKSKANLAIESHLKLEKAMKALIKRYPSAFGAILLVGCICGGYLLCMGAGLTLQWVLHQMNDGSGKIAWEGGSHATDLLILMPIMGAITIFAAAIVFCIIACLFSVVFLGIAEMFADLKSTCQKLGGWLNRKTKAS